MNDMKKRVQKIYQDHGFGGMDNRERYPLICTEWIGTEATEVRCCV